MASPVPSSDLNGFLSQVAGVASSVDAMNLNSALGQSASSSTTLSSTLSHPTSGTFSFRWTTDPQNEPDIHPFDRTTFMLDGPWQALVFGTGNTSGNATIFPAWPCGSYVSSMSDLSVLPYTNESVSIITSSPASLSRRGSQLNFNSTLNSTTWVENTQGYPWHSSGWLAEDFYTSNLEKFRDGTDYARLPAKWDNSGVSVNTSISFTASETIVFPTGPVAASQVGCLGLLPTRRLTGVTGIPSILEDLKSNGVIGSLSFGMHIGSVSLNQSGSLVLGGYEQNRVIGQVGLNPFNPVIGLGNDSIPIIELRDVVLGVEYGASPFNQSSTVSVFKPQPYGPTLPEETGSRYRGTMFVIPNPALPYIYLPFGTCDAAAAFLPVIQNSTVGFYVWNQDDPRYQRIMSSPSYLGFIISGGRNDTNVTIKVPFQLLNLIFTKELFGGSIPYFPCKTVDSTRQNIGALGRAFLQAAFFGINFEQNISFIAQAPGPDMDRNVTLPIAASADNISSGDGAWFEKSWRRHWTPLNDSSDDVPPSTLGRLSIGGIIGIVIGIVSALSLSIAVVKLSRSRRRKKNKKKNTKRGHGSNALPIEAEGVPVSELGRPLPHEIEGRDAIAEADASRVIHEAPLALAPQELRATTERSEESLLSEGKELVTQGNRAESTKGRLDR